MHEAPRPLFSEHDSLCRNSRSQDKLHLHVLSCFYRPASLFSFLKETFFIVTNKEMLVIVRHFISICITLLIYYSQIHVLLQLLSTVKV